MSKPDKQPYRTLIEAGIAELIIDKPPVNALSSTDCQALAQEIDRLGDLAEVRVIIIRSEGRGFCAGADIKEMAEYPERIVALNAGNYDIFRAVHRNKVPVIAAVHGFVLGTGIGICGASDVVVASECASFGLPEVDRGAMGGAAHLSRMFSVQKVRYLFFTGEMVSASEAYRLNAVERVVPREHLRTTAIEIATKIAAKSPAMIRIAKEALNGIEDGNLEDKYRWEQGFTLQAYLHPESAETRRAFVEKRDAKFGNK